jgi:hypothetical protein
VLTPMALHHRHLKWHGCGCAGVPGPLRVGRPPAGPSAAIPKAGQPGAQLPRARAPDGGQMGVWGVGVFGIGMPNNPGARLCWSRSARGMGAASRCGLVPTGGPGGSRSRLAKARQARPGRPPATPSRHSSGRCGWSSVCWALPDCRGVCEHRHRCRAGLHHLAAVQYHSENSTLQSLAFTTSCWPGMGGVLNLPSCCLNTEVRVGGGGVGGVGVRVSVLLCVRTVLLRHHSLLQGSNVEMDQCGWSDNALRQRFDLVANGTIYTPLAEACLTLADNPEVGWSAALGLAPKGVAHGKLSCAGGRPGVRWAPVRRALHGCPLQPEPRACERHAGL